MMSGEEEEDTMQVGVLTSSRRASTLDTFKVDRIRGPKREAEISSDGDIGTKRLKTGGSPGKGKTHGRKISDLRQTLSSVGRGGGFERDGGGLAERGRGRGRGRGSRRLDSRTPVNSRYGRTHGKNILEQGNFRPLSSKLLTEILEKDPSEAATELGSLKGSLKAGLNEDLMDEARQHLFWKALAFVCKAIGTDQTVIMLLALVLDSKLFKQYLRTSLIKLRCPGQANDGKSSVLFKNVMAVLHSIVQILPSRASDLKVASTLISDAVTCLEGYDESTEIIESIKSLNSHIEDIEKERETKRQMDRISKNPPPDDFRQQDILPTVKELQAGYQPFLRPHLTRGVYADGDHYLDVQFRLLKEDFIFPLRNGISEYLTFKKANPERRAKLQDVRIYEDAHFMKSVRDFSGISHYMAFKRLPRVRWHSTKRLMYGSLLILSSDDFKSYIFATVTKRYVEDLEKGLVAISLVDQEDASCLLNKRYVMAESSVFFEAYRPVLLGLQRMSGPCLPFSRYILRMCYDVKTPAYQKDHSDIKEEKELALVPCKIDISPLLHQRAECSKTVEMSTDGTWPSVDDVQLDQSQYEAVKTALTKEISVIQGPPGTGKTYIGLKIVETLLHNRKVWSSEENPSPILLVCYTNHALDQFLEGILTFHSHGLVRVGSRSKSNVLQSFNLNRMVARRGGRDNEYVQRRVRHVKREVDAARRRVERTQARIEGIRYGIINEYELGPFMSWQHYDTLLHSAYHSKRTRSWLVEWLLCECQYDRDWNQHGQHDRVEERNEVQEEEHGKSPNPECAAKEDTIEVEYERSAIESERMIDAEDDQEESDEEEDEDHPFLGLDLNDLDKAEHSILRRFIQRKLSGIDVLDHRVFDSIVDVWSMHPNERWALYHIWLKNYLGQLREKLPAYELKFKQLCGQLDEAKDVEKYQILREATIIGMTTTGAANHQQVLQRVRPRIVIVEEAAEVLEAHIITALNASCQQLILIGDHQQLRPKPNVYLLAKKYHLDVSLFERLINNDFPYSQLELQHRMRIELSDLMRRHFYNNLHDHDTVKQYESVKAVEKDIFFIDHAEPEDEMEDTQSHYNLHEARLVVALCYYILQQGYEPGRVTILTAYTGQLLKIKQMMDRSKFEGVKVTSIDNYQGEENDIILVSFVRSNSHGHIGFLGISNRVCVSLSRAKKGLYCFGNFTMYAEKSELWKGIVNDLKSTGSLGDSLTLQCTNHPEEKTSVKTEDDFENVPQGGCNRFCDTRLDCGHVCRLKCHPTDRRHHIYQCQAPCTKVICERNHECPKLCSDPCPTSCSFIVEKLLPCRHTCKAKCKTDIGSIRCEVKVDKTLSCSHVRLLPCYMTTEGLENECEVIINKELQCGHRKKEKCNGSGRCDEMVLKTLKCNHTCLAECHKDPCGITCKENVEKTLPCGHTHNLLCSTSTDNFRCNTITQKSLPCGHEIVEKCYNTSTCPEIVEKTLPCGHQLKMKCSTDVEKVACEARCSKKLSCGHTCQERCGLPCTENCSEMIIRDDWPCGHEVNVKCCDNRDTCYMVCGNALICGHSCKGICGKCSRNQSHLPCKEPCRKKLVCGHDCALNCGAPCLLCEQICPRYCSHFSCKHPCSELCNPCRNLCNWRCDHYKCNNMCWDLCDRPPCNMPCPKKRECGHPCIGLCGEICPNKCRICDREELEQRFFGTEDLEIARYIQLEDCDHFFEVGELDKFLGFETSSDARTSKSFTELSVKSCPRCEKPMQSSRRYGNLLKELCMIKMQIVLMLRQEELKTYQLLREVNSAVSRARKKLQHVQSPGNFYKPILCESYELLHEWTEELDKNNQVSPNELIDQRAFKTWSQVNRLRMLCYLIDHLKSGEYNIVSVCDLLQLLLQDSTLGEQQLTAANALLNQMYAAKRFGRLRKSRDLTVFSSPTYLSYELGAWYTSPRGHLAAQHQLEEDTCKECDKEEAEQGRVLHEASPSDKTGIVVEVRQHDQYWKYVPVHQPLPPKTIEDDTSRRPAPSSTLCPPAVSTVPLSVPSCPITPARQHSRRVADDPLSAVLDDSDGPDERSPLTSVQSPPLAPTSPSDAPSASADSLHRPLKAPVPTTAAVHPGSSFAPSPRRSLRRTSKPAWHADYDMPL